MIGPALLILKYALGIRDQICARRRLLTNSIYTEHVLAGPSDYILSLKLRRFVFPDNFILYIRGRLRGFFLRWYIRYVPWRGLSDSAGAARAAPPFSEFYPILIARLIPSKVGH
jgi:hypothetical protein